MSPPSSNTEREHDAGFDEAALYRVVRTAIEDAILSVLDTLLRLGVAVMFAFLGLLFFLSAVRSDTAALESAVTIIFGLLFGGFGCYLGAATLGRVPPLREWF